MLVWQKAVLAASVGIVLLLVASNIILLQILHDHNGNRATAVETQADQTASVPALPAPTSAGSSKALLKELNKTKRQINTPLDRALGQLEIMSNSTSTLNELPALLQTVVASMDQLSGATPQLRVVSKQLRSMNKKFRKTSDLVVGFGPVLTDLEKTMHEIQTDTARIRACSEKSAACS
jgi:DNA repair ATPase RecN